MKERIQKILASRSIASRRGAEALISAGRVSCNGTVCSIGDSADPDLDEICLDGKPIPSNVPKLYIMLNKPAGYVTTLSDEYGRRNAAQLVADCGKRVFPVGRLDMDSQGLLIFTNDGEFANKVMHPSHQVNKTYRVLVKNYSQAGLERLKQPIVLDGYKIQPPDVLFVGMNSQDATLAELEITIHEGRNRQVRRMCASAGMPVVRLVRIAEGKLCLGRLAPGKWRYLTEEEILSLIK